MMQGLAEIPMFPLGWPFMPTERVVLQVFEPRYIAMVREIESRPLEDGNVFGTVMIERGSEVGGCEVRGTHGVLIGIDRIRWAGMHRAAIVGFARNVIEVLNWRTDDPYPKAVVELSPWITEGLDGPAAIAFVSAADAVRELRTAAFAAGAALDPTLEVGGTLAGTSETVWALCTAAPLGEHDRYRLLCESDATDRLRILELMCRQRIEMYRFGSM